MRPRILFVMHYMELGGAESALLGLLHNMDFAKVEVDLFLYRHSGDLLRFVPTNFVRMLPMIEVYSLLEQPLSIVLKKGFVKLALYRLMGKCETYFRGGDESVNQIKWACKILPDIGMEQEYDMAISFVTPHYIVLDHVKAKKKVGWIHTDYTTLPFNTQKEIKMWERLDTIVSISSDVTKTFLQVFPTLEDKIVEIENVLSPEFVRQRAEEIIKENYNEDENSYCLLSIGRICPPKNYDNVPYIAKFMKEMGVKFHWYIIGPGNHADIDQTIEDTGTGDVVTFLGPRSNPYPYIKACDVYLQPSRYEGKSVTVREAQILCKPVVVTNYTTAPSQIKDGLDGVIVPMDNEGCAKGIVEFLKGEEKQSRIVDYLKTHDFGNVSEVEKIYDLIKS